MSKYQVCPRCEGEGTHTNPSIDGNGITSSEWAEWDEEDREMYMTGGYDVQCELCKGQRVVTVTDLAEHAEYRADRRLAALEDGDYQTMMYYS